MSGRQYQNISYSFDLVGNVLGYENDCMDGLRYSVSQSYGYDDLYQLTSAHGETTNDPFKGGIPDYRSTYDQSYSFDVIGNMTRKTSGSGIYPQKTIGSYLDYDFDYGYAAGYAHRLDHAGGRYYRYDLDGNITMEHHGPIPEGLPGGGSGSTGGGSGSGSDDDFWDDMDGNGQYTGSWDGDMAGDGTGSDDDFWDELDENGQYTGSWDGDMAGDDDFWDDWDENSEYSGSWTGNTDSGNGSGSDDDFWDDLDENGQYTGSWDGDMGGGSGTGTGAQQDNSILAVYEWDERDRLVRSQTPDVTAFYVYGEDGRRTNKYTSDSETLYFSRLWTWHDGRGTEDQTSKHIYLGSERIVTQMNSWKGQQTYSEELNKTYYYHPDHLGSAQLITDNKGHEYQRIEYTPYGETWVDKIEDPLYVYMPYKFTGKELDEETGLYYYGARYMDPMYSVWISPDPALGDYLPTAGADNSSLPGMGGVFNSVNMQLYHYAGNNPLKYIDPNGNDIDYFDFDFENYFCGQLKGLFYGFRAAIKDSFGQNGNYFSTLFSKTRIESCYIDAEICFGTVSLTGTFEINSKGETSFSFTKPTDMLLSEVEKLIDLPITIDTNGISTDIPMYKGLVDVNAVVAIEKGNEENSCKLKLGAKVGKEAKVYGDIKGGASVGAGIKIILQPSFQDGPFGTIENRKDNKINTDIRKANHYNSIDFFMRNIR